MQIYLIVDSKYVKNARQSKKKSMKKMILFNALCI